MLRKRQSPPRDTFPPDPWSLSIVKFEADLAADYVGQAETAFALANGYLGIRGSFDEGSPVEEAGVFLNGFYETRPITYGESAYGFPRAGQSILSCPDGTVLRLIVDDEPFDVLRAEILEFRRVLDFASGTLTRDVVWATPRGKRLKLSTTRLVSLASKHLAAIDWELVPLDADVDVVLSSELIERRPLPVAGDDPRLAEPQDARVLTPRGTVADGLRTVLSYVTGGSSLTLGCGMDHVFAAERPFTTHTRAEDAQAITVFRTDAPRGRPVRLTKFLAYHYGAGTSPGEIRAEVGWTLDRARELGFPALADRQRAEVAAFWERSDVKIDAPDPTIQQVVRWNLFQLLQASHRVEGHGIGARGLTGRTYEGHYFWDTEIYVVPFLIYTAPTVARNVLKFRYDMLPRARLRAAELGHPGATFPWRTINGHEASAYYAAGTAQYHINADIAYTVRKYVEVTGDTGFLHRYGAEILVETARFWRDLGFFSARRDGRFCINSVTGPDEYNAVVDNNYFTNLMAQENLRYAAWVVDDLAARHPEVHRALEARTGLRPGEPKDWADAAERMYLPFDERLGVHPQDDAFLDKEVWDFENTPEDCYPLLLHYHPLNLYRFQVIKQVDTLLAMFLMNERFTAQEKKRNFDYYDPITTHDSSLSVCIQSIIANEIGYSAKAFEYFDFAATMDFSDIGGNMKNGAHVASIGGTWMALVYGFAGMRDGGGEVSFHPRLPPDWRGLRFPVTIRGNRVSVAIDQDKTLYRLEQGDGLTVRHAGEPVRLTPEAPEACLATPAPAPVEQKAGLGAADPAVS